MDHGFPIGQPHFFWFLWLLVKGVWCLMQGEYVEVRDAIKETIQTKASPSSPTYCTWSHPTLVKRLRRKRDRIRELTKNVPVKDLQNSPRSCEQI